MRAKRCLHFNYKNRSNGPYASNPSIVLRMASLNSLSILGVAAGIASLESDSEKESAQRWLADIISQGSILAPGENWDKSLRKIAALLVASPGVASRPDPSIDGASRDATAWQINSKWERR